MICSYQFFNTTHFTTSLNMSSQYGSKINQNKEDNSSKHPSKKLAKLCRIFCNMVGKKRCESKRYTDSIENHFYICINIDDNVVHSEYVSKWNGKLPWKLHHLVARTHTALASRSEIKWKYFKREWLGRKSQKNISG